MVTELEQVRAQLDHLQGQIDGAVSVLKWGLGTVGSILVALLGYVWARSEKVVDVIRVRTHELANSISAMGGRVIALETWRIEHEKVADAGLARIRDLEGTR